MNKRKNEILVAGFAQFPKGTPVYEMQKVMACVLIIDRDTEIIVDATLSFVLDMTRDFAASLLIGQSLKNGVQEIIKEIEEKLIIPGQRAVIQALIAAYDRYRELGQKG